jgi:hypothetical protein
MNKRQYKKYDYNKACGLLKRGSYRKRRIMNRKSEVASIKSARRCGYNYWNGWEKGYPNRYRVKAILNKNYLTFEKERRKRHECI